LSSRFIKILYRNKKCKLYFSRSVFSKKRKQFLCPLGESDTYKMMWEIFLCGKKEKFCVCGLGVV
jgi:hypothetical protein